MPRALWNDRVIAEADSAAVQVVEGNTYFPPSALKREYFADSATTSTCPWKGTASYYTVAVDGKANPDAAWTYRDPKEAARQIRDYVAFWKGVKVEA